MTETLKSNYDGYASATDRCKVLFGSEVLFRKEKGLGDFICHHMRGYKEAPCHIKRCFDCEMWRSEKGITSDFWCKHNKFYKKEWDESQGW